MMHAARSGRRKPSRRAKAQIAHHREHACDGVPIPLDGGRRSPNITSVTNSFDPITSVVTKNPACARVFQRHDIDFCGSNPGTVAAAASARGLDLADLLQELDDASRDPLNFICSLDALKNAALVERITSRFHLRLREVSLPWVTTHSARLSRTHGRRWPLLRELDQTLWALARELSEHTSAEETSLFPLISASGRDRGGIERELLTMYDEHEHVHALVRRARVLKDALEFVEGTDGECHELLAAVTDLELEISLHMHAENHILLPRCLAN
jgi:regulator of cell morphogenesis and NO signaling